MTDDKKEGKDNSLEGISKQLSFNFPNKPTVGGMLRDIDQPGITVVDGIAYEWVAGGKPLKLGRVENGRIHVQVYGSRAREYC